MKSIVAMSPFPIYSKYVKMMDRYLKYSSTSSQFPVPSSPPLPRLNCRASPKFLEGRPAPPVVRTVEGDVVAVLARVPTP